MRVIILSLVAATISACAPNSVADLRQSGGQVTEFQLKENYQSVYRRLSATARRCTEVNLVTAQMVVRSELYSDLGSAEISYELFGVNNEVYSVVDLEKIKGGTHVKVTTAPGFERELEAVKRHLKGSC